MSSIKEYFKSVGQGVKSLVAGMGVTGKEFVTPKITEQYPENRKTLQIADRFRAELTLKYDAEGRHKCIACGICQMNCPNGTIKLETKMVELPDGKKKRKLDKYLYDLGSCTFCIRASGIRTGQTCETTQLSTRTGRGACSSGQTGDGSGETCRYKSGGSQEGGCHQSSESRRGGSQGRCGKAWHRSGGKRRERGENCARGLI